ncbi:MAG: hypothetical protein P8M26_10470 [Gammaproteobacteria bacterium]|nr:hypothetical protein [Gammaproteobacteria bacterium]
MRHVFIVLIGALCVVSCARVSPPSAAPDEVVEPGMAWLAAATAYTVSDGDALLVVRAYRAGAMASLGHNHVISSDVVAGNIYVGSAYTDSWFDLIVPVSSLVVDDERIRAHYGEDFSAPVPEDAKAGTKINMQSERVLDATNWPLIRVRGFLADCLGAACTAHVAIDLGGTLSRHIIPLQMEQHDDRLLVRARFNILQSKLGLSPFSVMMGALSVADELRFDLDLVAVAVTPDDLVDQ